MSNTIKTQVVVIGSGPGGYSAAFRCADLGMDTVIVERYLNLGGVCLNVGCIPSKTLLHIAKLISSFKLYHKYGVIIGDVQIDIDKIRSWKNKVISQLTDGLSGMARTRKVKVINGYGSFIGANTLCVESNRGISTISFDYAIIAAGSKTMKLPLIPYEDPRIWNSTDALELISVPKRLLIIGGGVIGLEMATVYCALGSRVDVIEMADQIIPVVDKDVIKIFNKCINNQFNLFLETRVTMVQAKTDGIYVSMSGKSIYEDIQCYDAVLVAAGRIPNGELLGIEKIGIKVDELGFIYVDKQLRTNISHVFAIGDIIGSPMLAHKSSHEGRIAAEVIAGKKSYFDPKVIPSIVYTDPEIAWIGVTEKIAQKQGINYEAANYPWLASGRAVAYDCVNGITKLIFNRDTHKVIGGEVVGDNGGELLGEIGLAIEMGCDVEDIALTIHAHPTLYESVRLAAEIYEGSITDLLNVKANIKK